nr:hypothetical protein [Methylibium sp.]
MSTTAWVRHTAACSAGAPGYAYSSALKGATVIWSKATLERWLTDPEAVLPGQRVGVNVPEAVDRADLIEYLERISIAK